jgi:hypothetical protein
MKKMTTQFDLHNANGMPMCLTVSGRDRDYSVWVGYYHDLCNQRTHTFKTKKAAIAAYQTLSDFYTQAAEAGSDVSPGLSLWVLMNANKCG